MAGPGIVEAGFFYIGFVVIYIVISFWGSEEDHVRHCSEFVTYASLSKDASLVCYDCLHTIYLETLPCPDMAVTFQ